ncbi:MAG: hypothetical protein A7316_01970 [Candidatus Altiarchaeales archaeon WOR_SM1_86-2]|nr:MAG: hypothetical protein A7316_01970 [Candidatus Altiarchaeales archaeon WOR_SM1_86-2]
MSEIKLRPYPGIDISLEPRKDMVQVVFIRELSKAIHRARQIKKEMKSLGEGKSSISGFADVSDMDLVDAMGVASEMKFESRWSLDDMERALKILKDA